ncbi:ornithine decarboxylase-like isoform X2 [Oscarella lobularis]|uniref:ornithine decarboxylase-like isoform X2 n=1 Tax=Oscarella lobularis TaxID=121494 RepID=UPI0033144B33
MAATSTTLGSTSVYRVEKSLTDVVSDHCAVSGRLNPDDSFYIVDLGTIIKKCYQWKKNLPRVEPFYAFKCNSDPLVLKTLALLGLGFDCASKSEMKTVLDMGLDSSRIVYANPCKQISHLKFACQNDVKRMTFDNEYELFKIKKYFPSAELLLRIRADDSKSLCQLGIKFGAETCHAHHLLSIAKQLNLNVIGISFHVGSGCYDVKPFSDAVASSKEVFLIAEKLGFDFSVLDIGGGYPGADEAPITFEEIADELNNALDVHFPEGCGIDIIAEPGRFFACASHTLAVSIIGKRLVDQSGEKTDIDAKFMYYVNDGVYSSFNCLLFDHATVHPKLIKKASCGDDVATVCSIWGPTCDSMDCVMEKCVLPELEIGDWLYFENMGAYTKSAASSFNGFPVSFSYYVVSADVWEDFVLLAGEDQDVKSLFPKGGPCKKPVVLFSSSMIVAVNSSV